MTIYSKLDEIGTLSKYINKLKDEMRDEKRNREEADTDYQNAVRKLEKGELIYLVHSYLKRPSIFHPIEVICYVQKTIQFSPVYITK